jgi:alpha/beta superfamily hydrolase
MNVLTESRLLDGLVGAIEVAIDRPEVPRAAGGVAVIAHPHPLFGGTMHNKVVQTLARAHLHTGWTSVRFHFRGVGQSAGVHDGGHAETQDLLHVIQALAPSGPLALAGFSFGGYVAVRAAAQLMPLRPLDSFITVGTAVSRFEVPPLPQELHGRSLILHGEQDDTVALTAVMDWARPQGLPVTVIPEAEHFFHGRLPLLKSLAIRHLLACGAA